LSRLEVISSFAAYEIKRAIARRKVLILVAFTVLLSTLPYYAFSRIAYKLPAPAFPYIWVVGFFLAGPLLLNFTAILIAAGAMSEEYEQGTAELLLSKPVKRGDYFFGKFLGGYVLFLSILAIDIFLTMASAFAFFGPQSDLGLLPGFFLAQAFSSLLFYSLAFMLGELLRRSSLAYIFSSTLFFASLIIGVYLEVIYTLTSESFYHVVGTYLPTTAADSLPQQYILSGLPSTISSLLQTTGFLGSSGSSGTIESSIALVLLYAVSGLVVAVAYFHYADISRRVS
jgi:ABC-2 type transport system permease protein